MKNTEITLNRQEVPKVGTKAFNEFKATVCDNALKLKKKLDKLAEQYGEIISQLEIIFNMDDKQYFSEFGTVKKEVTNNYSIAEQNVQKVIKILEKNNLTIDDYINQKTSWGVTSKLRTIINNQTESIGQELAGLIDVKHSERISVKTS
ncbi:MAG: hypothetical protein AMXMBFR51_20890 [Ignavibacteriota bacterium]